VNAMKNLNEIVHTGSTIDPEVWEFEKYQSLINTEFSLDSDGVIISSNLGSANVSGYEDGEIIGKDFNIFFPEPEREKIHQHLLHAIEHGEIVIVGMCLKKQGGVFWARMHIRHAPESNSKAAYRVTIQDAAHRTTANMRIRTILDEYLNIFNNPFIGVFKFRLKDNRLLMCNEKIWEIISPKNRNISQFNDFFRSSSQFEQFLSLLKEQERIEGFKFLINDHNPDSENWGLLSARYFKVQGFVEGVLMDISEQYDQLQKLERVNSALDTFVYHASHDLRAPLTTIIGLVNLGVREQSVHIVHSYMEMIRARVSHLDLLLKDLISVSYNSKEEVSAEPIVFEEEIKIIVDSVKTHPVEVRVSIEQSREFATDKVRIQTILKNLLANAIKYHNPAVEKPIVKINISVSEETAYIQIQDNGIGIEPLYRDKIFDMFFRATIQSTGAGLGLYIVKSMLDKLKGKISLESTVGVGTTFLLVVPSGKHSPSDQKQAEQAT